MSSLEGAAAEVSRDDLCGRLSTALDRRVTVLRAPAGYGKSTAIKQATKVWRAAGATVEQVSGAVDETVGGILASVASGRSRTMLVLEEFHTADDAAWARVIPAIATSRANVHIVMATRRDPPPEVLAACRRVGHETLGSAQLRFSASECRAALRTGWSPDRTAAQSDELHLITGGWPAAIAAIARSGGKGRVAVGHDDGSRSPVRPPRSLWETYVRREVLDTQQNEVRAFLCGSVFLEAVNSELCDAVLGRRDSAAMIGRLVAQEWLIPSSDEPGWFDHHPLLAETLRDALHDDEPTTGRLIRGLAARWYAERGDRRRTLATLLALGDYGAAATVLLGTAGPQMASGSRVPSPAAPPIQSSTGAVLTELCPFLSPRELEVLRLLAEGMENKAIAHRLYVSVGTVKSHVYKMFRKLKAGNRTLAVARARLFGLIG